MAYDQVAGSDIVQKTIANFSPRNIEGMVVATKEDALAKIKELIPAGASVMNGASRTLEQIGFIDYLKTGQHGWNNLHAAINAEKDPAKQGALRKQATLSDYYLGSVHAVAETGELVIASNSGSQLPNIVFNSPNLIFVVGAQKITPTLEAAKARLQEYVIPLEDARMMEAMKVGTKLNKELVFHGEATYTGRKVRVIFVNEKLGF